MIYHPTTADLIRDAERMRARLRRQSCTCITCRRQLKTVEAMLSTLARIEANERLAVLS